MSSSSSEDADNRHRAATVEVIMNDIESGVVASSSVPASASSGAPDCLSIVEKALAKLPPEIAAQAKDPKRKARSSDPGWKYGFWPDPTKKEMIQCIFCDKVVPAGVKRFKQHLAGGYSDAEKCPHAPEIVRKEMDARLKQNSRTVIVVPMDEEAEQEGDDNSDPVHAATGDGMTSSPAEQATGRNVPTRAAAIVARATSINLSQTRKRPRKTRTLEDIIEYVPEEEDNAIDQDSGQSDAEMDEEDSGSGPSGPAAAAAATTEDGGTFQLDQALLF